MGRNRTVRLHVVAASAVALALLANGCSGPESDKTPAAPATGAAAPSPLAAESPARFAEGQDQTVSPPPVRYSCENGTSVVAQYVESDTGEQHVKLEIDGKEYGLALAQSASGARYEAASGLHPDKKLTWWTKGDGAMLIEADAGDTDGESEGVVNCQEALPAP